MADFDFSSVDNLAQPPASPASAPAENSGLDFSGVDKVDAQQGILPTVEAGFEGALRGLTLGASDVIAKQYGDEGQDFAANRAAHPLASGLGEILGTAPTITLTEGAGLIPKAETLAGKIAVGSGVGSVIGGVSTANNDLAFGDPNLNASKILQDAGLGSVIGGAIGGLGSIFMEGASRSLKSLGAMAEKLGIKPELPADVSGNIESSGLEIDPVIQSALSQNPELAKTFQLLQESNTPAGMEAQQALKDFRGQAQAGLVSALGKSPEDITNLHELSDFDIGRNVQSNLNNELTEQYQPIKDLYGRVNEQFQNVPFTPEDSASIQQQLGQLIQEKGYYLSPDLPASKIVQSTLRDLDNIQNLNDVRKYTSLINDKTQSPDLWNVGSSLRNIFRNSEANILNRSLEEAAPELAQQHAQARGAYADLMNTMDSLNDRLHVGKYYGPESFISALNDMAPEDILRRLSGKNDAQILNVMNERFPETASVLKDYQVNNVLKNAALRAPQDQLINTTALFNSLDKMSPEQKAFAFPETLSTTQGNPFNSIRTLMEGIPGKINPSGTAGTIASLWKHVSGATIGMLAAIFEHNPLLGLGVGSATNYISRDIPDAIKLSTLRRTQSKMLDGIARSLLNTDESIGNKARLIFTGTSSQARKFEKKR